MINFKLIIPKVKRVGVKNQEEEEKERMNLINLLGLYEALKLRLSYFDGIRNNIMEKFIIGRGAPKINLENYTSTPVNGSHNLVKLSVKGAIVKQVPKAGLFPSEYKNKPKKQGSVQHKGNHI
jgi:hypothetical protein